MDPAPMGHNRTRTNPPESMASKSDATTTTGEPGDGVAKETWDSVPVLDGRIHLGTALLLLALVLATYANSFAGGFWGDSGAVVLEDPRMHEVSRDNLDLILRQQYWYPDGGLRTLPAAGDTFLLIQLRCPGQRRPSCRIPLGKSGIARRQRDSRLAARLDGLEAARSRLSSRPRSSPRIRSMLNQLPIWPGGPT